MKKIILPNTNIETSRLGFGTASLHHIKSSRKRINLLSEAYELGFRHFDTARMYGEGMAERELGKFISQGNRKNITVASKFGLPANEIYEKFPFLMYGSKVTSKVLKKIGFRQAIKHVDYQLSVKHVDKSIMKTMEALKTNWLDIIFLHEPLPQLIDDIEKLSSWLKKQKQSGRVRHIGLSGNAYNCIEIYKKLPDLFDVFQIEDSIENKEADNLAEIGMPFQITFGYLRLTNLNDREMVFKEALQRNNAGMILVSSRNINHLKNLVSIEGEIL